MYPTMIFCTVLIALDAIFRRGTVPALNYAFAAVIGLTLYLTTGFLMPAGPLISHDGMTALHLLCCYLCLRLMWCGSDDALGLARCAILFNAAVSGAMALWYLTLQITSSGNVNAVYFLLFLMGLGLLFQQTTGMVIFLALLVLLVGTSCVLSVRSGRLLCRYTRLTRIGRILLMLSLALPFVNLIPLLVLLAWTETARHSA